MSERRDRRETYYREDAMIADVRAEWREQALCAEVSIEDEYMEDAWTNPRSLYAERARMICEECPVRMACLHDALGDLHAEGMRGGFVFDFGNLEPMEAALLYREFKLRIRSRRARRTGAEKIA